MMALKKNPRPAPEPAQRPDSQISLIAAGVLIEGSIQSKGDLRVEGHVKGNILCTSKLVVGRGGRIEGEVDTKGAAVAGRIEGHLFVHDVLVVQETGHVSGEVVTLKFENKPGGQVSGSLKMGQDAQQMLTQRRNELAKAEASQRPPTPSPRPDAQ